MASRFAALAEEMALTISKPGVIDSPAIPFMSLVRFDAPTAMQSGMLRPSVCIALQGQKALKIGEHNWRYGAGEFLISGVKLPLSGQVVNASPDAPYLGLTLRFEAEDIFNLLTQSEMAVPDGKELNPVSFIGHCPAPLTDVIARLLAQHQRGGDRYLCSLLRNECLYYLLQSTNGQALARTLLNGREQGLNRALSWLNQHFAEPLKVEELASQAGMSVSHFHRRFKAVMSLGPLQYQKQLRLIEARRQLMTGKAEAASVAFAVGYESPSQFSREYRRLFGLPPMQDMQHWQNHIEQDQAING